jgi:glyoxylase-like metal-dependent hydrolase (beta-lactamase superfamily II)
VATYVGSPNGFLVTSHIVEGKNDLIVIDAQFTKSDASALKDKIKSTGKNLKTVFVTHGHPDHYFGVEVLKLEFPNARYVAVQSTIDDIQKTGEGKLAYWNTVMPKEMPSKVPALDAVVDEDLRLDGETLQLVQLAAAESDHASMVVVNSIGAAFAGDMLYDDVHLWLAEAKGRTDAWKQNLNTLQNNSAVKTIYVGHQAKARANGKNIIDTNLAYINFAEEVFTSAQSSAEAAAQLKAQYPTYQLPVIADLAAQAWVK